MSEGLDISLVKETYRKFSDHELIRLASSDAHNLTPAAQQAIKEEITFRRLDPGLIAAIDTQNDQITVDELDRYCELIRSFDCPYCKKPSVLSAVKTSETMSFIIITYHKKKILIGCNDCLKKENNTALFTTLGLGWWGVPFGIIRSIGSVSNYIRSSKSLKSDAINDTMRAFVYHNLGLFKLYQNDPDRLNKLIYNQNNGISSSANNI